MPSSYNLNGTANVSSGLLPSFNSDGIELRENGRRISRQVSENNNVEDAEPEERQKWAGKWHFLCSCIASAVGLGNVWRFPVTAFKNGGGAFLIPYFVILILIGRPMYFLELTLGQFTSCSQVKCWKLAPFFKGVGYGAMLSIISILTYYVYIMALTVYYFVVSFQTTLPWSFCDEAWAGEDNCFANGSSVTNSSIPELYFLKAVTKKSASLDEGLGLPDWRLCLCLCFSWLAIFGTLYKGVKSSGRVSYFTAGFPYLILVILLIRGLTLEGAMEGIYYFVKPDFQKLLEPKVWFAAAGQCFFSLTVGLGSIIMYGSYNRFNHVDIYRDALLASTIDVLTSLLAGFTVFAILGNLSSQLGVDIDKVAEGGPGLVFISYPYAISKLEWCPQIFAVLFFAMMFTLGLGSSVSIALAVVSVIWDRFPKLVKWHVALAMCTVGCALGIVYTTPGGLDLLSIVDFYGGGFLLYAFTILEIIGIAWVYGLYNYVADVEFMLKRRLGYYWKICWGFVIPILLPVILFYFFTEKGFGPDGTYPTWAIVFGALISAAALLAFPIAGIQAMMKLPGTISEKFAAAFQPSELYGPKELSDRLEWIKSKADREDISIWERIRLWQL